jgi:hypothetical protein
VRVLTSQGEGEGERGEGEERGEEEREEGRDELGSMGSVVRRKLLAARGSRRSATPIPAYEPPKDVFTPPREVVMPPPPSTVRRANGKGKGKGRQSSVAREKQGETAVKQEMPDIDLKAPMPPPSPGDDPLLLSSDIEEIECLPPPVVQHKTPKQKQTTKKRGKDTTGKKSTVKKSGASTSKKSKGGRTPGSTRKTLLESTTSTAVAAEVVLQEEEEEGGEEMLNRGPLDFDLPPSSPPPVSDSEDGGNFDWTQGATVEDQYLASTEDSLMHLDPADADVEPLAVGLLDFEDALKNHASNTAAGWSSDEEEGDHQDEDAEGRGEYTGRWRMKKVRTKTDPPSEATAYRMEEWGRPVSPYPGVRRLHLDPGQDDALPEEPVEEPSTPRNEVVGLGLEEPAETPRVDTTVLPPSEAEVEEEEAREEEEEAREEEEVMRMSIEPEEEAPEAHTHDEEQEDDDDVQQEVEPEPLPVTPANNRAFDFDLTSSYRVPLNDVEQASQDVVDEDDDGNEEDLSDLDLGMVKIVSADPRAAARAAAILKQVRVSFLSVLIR